MTETRLSRLFIGEIILLFSRSNPRPIVHFTISSFLAISAGAFAPLTLGHAIDVKDIYWFLAYAVLFSASASLGRSSIYLGEKLNSEIIYFVSMELFKRILQKEERLFREKNASEMQSAIIQGQNGARMVVSIVLYSALPALLHLVLSGTILFSKVGIYVFLITICYGILYFFGIFFSNHRTRTFLHLATSSIQNAAGQLGVSISGITSIRYFGAERWAISKYSSSVEKMKRNWNLWAAFHAKFSVVFFLLSLIQFVINYILLIPELRAGNITIGDIVLFNALILQMNGPLETLGNVFGQFTQAEAAIMPAAKLWYSPAKNDNIYDTKDYPLVFAANSLSAERLSYGVNGARAPLQTDVSFNCNRGTLSFIVGESGSGKSTLLRVIARSLAPISGEVLLDRTPIYQFSEEHWRSIIAIVPQDPFLMAGTIRDNVCMGREASNEELDEALRASSLSETISSFALGLETEVGQMGSNLSGGERQRIALARALLKKPQILLLDEASAALDEATEKAIMTAIRNILPNTIVIAITHRTQIIETGDNVIHLKKIL